MSANNDFVATEALYLDKDGKVVKHNDPAKAVKLADVGHHIPYERAMELGLVNYEPPIREATEEEEAAELELKEAEGDDKDTGGIKPAKKAAAATKPVARKK